VRQYQAESGLQLFKIKLQPAVATALWAVVKSTAEIDRPQANAFEGGITMSSLPVAISTGRVISDSRFPTPL